MNSACMQCRDITCAAVLRSGGYAAFFYCPVRKRRITHLMPGDPLPCITPRDGAADRTPAGDILLSPPAAVEVPA